MKLLTDEEALSTATGRGPRPKPVRAAIARTLTAAVGLSLAAAPALAETRGVAAVASGFDSHGTSVERFSIDLGGLTLHGVERNVVGRRIRLGRVALALGASGVDVELSDVDVLKRESVTDATTHAKAPTELRNANEPIPKADLVPGLERWRTQVRRLARIPITVRLIGDTNLATRHGSSTVEGARVAIDADGGVSGNLRARFDAGPGARGRADLTFETTLAADATVTATANIAGDERLGQFGVDLELAGSDAAARIVHGDGGALVEISRGPGRDATLRLHAEHLAVGWLESLGNKFGAGPGLAKLEINEAHVDGSVQLERRGSRLDVSFDNARVSEVIVDERAIAREPIRIDTMSVSGSAVRDGDRLAFDGELGHGSAALHASVSLSPSRFRLGIALPPTECQSLLGSLPRGFMTVLEGMAVEGTVAGSFSLDVDRTDLSRYRQDEANAGPLDVLRPPGRVELGLPVIDECRIVREPPGVDVASLRGPYRHQFVADDGTSRDRVLATGAPGFVNAAAAARVAAAFVVLEDARFYAHDGFDRDQIERALWHNLAHGRIDRGASTISQQTARNLWLGIDRSMSRKLQEAFLTAHLERHVDKRRILEIYLGIIELGPAVHGVVDAARFHFGRAVTDLNTVEALHLASLAPSPAPYSRRFANGEVDPAWREALTQQARRLRIHGYIGARAARAAAGEKLGLLDRAKR